MPSSNQIKTLELTEAQANEIERMFTTEIDPANISAALSDKGLSVSKEDLPKLKEAVKKRTERLCEASKEKQAHLRYLMSQIRIIKEELTGIDSQCRLFTGSELQ